MRKIINLIGQKFNKLTIKKLFDKDKSGNYRYLCSCDCGKETIVIGTSLKKGHIKSCGCLRGEREDCWIKGEIEFLKINYSLRGPQFCTNKLNRTYLSVAQKGNSLCLKSPSLTIIKTFKKQEKIIKELGDNKVLCKCKNHGIVVHYNRKRALPKCSLCEKQRVAKII